MHSFECALEYVEDAGVEFVLRIATRFPAGETAKGRGADAPKLAKNPFEEPEPALVVGDLTPTHRAMLNKFSVLREHLLIVTKRHADQRELLNEADFEALAIVMKEAEVLAFYNGGPEAGASQGHKHLQVVTLPLSPRHSVPMDTLLTQDQDRMAGAYAKLHEAAGLRVPQPYNLLVTHEWMLIVPRSRDKFEDVSINSLAFAGSFFIRDAAHAHKLSSARPMSVLKSVAMP
jgi:ATP adenylyltransferase